MSWGWKWQVDCAYYTDDLAEVNEDPVAELKRLMNKRYVTVPTPLGLHL